MSIDTSFDNDIAERKSGRVLQDIPRFLLAPMPLFILQPALRRIINVIAQRHPELFIRIGTHKNKLFMIDPVNMPFVLMLRPDPENLSLRAMRRNRVHQWDARIAGSFLSLLDMVDGRLDGDAMFFTRDLMIDGDTEAVVCLRNALDDLDGSIADDIAELYGSPGRIGLTAIRKIRSSTHEN